MIAFRRTYKSRPSAVARKLYDLIRVNCLRLDTLNTDREWRPDSKGLCHKKTIQRKRHQLGKQFVQSLIVTRVDEPLTGLLLDGRAVESMRS